MRFDLCPGAGFVAACVVMAVAGSAQASVMLYEEGSRHVSVGGTLQAQYRLESPDDEQSVDDFFLRRAKFYIEGSITENVSGIWKVDLGGRGQDPVLDTAYIEYSGWSAARVIVGNHDVPFSREKLTSDKRQQTVERQFAGDSGFGVPDKQKGISLSGQTQTLAWQVGIYKAGIEPDVNRLDFASRVTEDAEYFGDLLGGRLDFNPLGHFRMAQGAFGSDLKFGIGINAFGWSNDDDDVVNAASDYDKVAGMGLDAALRMGYFSADVAYQGYRSETRDDSFTAGIIENGEGDFDTRLLKTGYMVVPSRLEAILAYSDLEADAWSERDTRISTGLNFFINKHNAKIQATYEFGRDVNGVRGRDMGTLYIQFQQVL